MKKQTKILSIALIIAICTVMFAACGGNSFDPSDLQKELNGLKDKYGELQTAFNTLQSELTAKQNQIDKLRTDGAATQEELDDALADIVALQTELSAKQTQINQLLADSTTAQSDIVALLFQIDALKAAIAAMSPIPKLTYGVGDWDGENSTYAASNRVRTGIHYVELGEYPCTYVGDVTNATLTNVFSSGSTPFTAATGRYYTSNSVTTSGTYTPKQNPEYLLFGERYVPVSILSYSANYPFSTGTNNGASGTLRWFKVEPIKWLIGNWDALPKSINPSGTGTADTMNLVAAELITAGIPFHASDTLWANSVIRAFLNGAFITDAFDTAERGLITSSTVPNNTTAGNTNTIGDGVSTTDKIFLPSYYEVYNASGMFNEVFNTDARRQGVLTDFAIANNAVMSLTTGSHRKGYWWLRSASSMYGAGIVSVTGNYFYGDHGNSLRPAVSVSLGSLYL